MSSPASIWRYQANRGPAPVAAETLPFLPVTFAAYLTIVEQGLRRSHFGFPNFFIPFVTAASARVCSMIRLLDPLTAGQGSKIFLFKTFRLSLSRAAAESERAPVDRAVATRGLPSTLF
jgi:hypothetical protein